MVDYTGKDFLVVEDDDMNYIYLKQIFSVIKGNIERAKNGTEAVDKCREKRFDLILMDIQLPDLSGTEATQQIREFNKEIPIIAQTASRTPYELNEIINAGCNHVVVKPFKFEELVAALGNFL